MLIPTQEEALRISEERRSRMAKLMRRLKNTAPKRSTTKFICGRAAFRAKQIKQEEYEYDAYMDRLRKVTREVK